MSTTAATAPTLPRCLTGVFFIFVACATAHAVTIYDIGGADALPDVIGVDTENSPVYITNAAVGEAGEAGDAGGDAGPVVRTPAETGGINVGQYSELHIGYDNAAVAVDDMSVAVTGDMRVRGRVMLGKDATNDQHNLPNPATTAAIGVGIGGTLAVESGGHVILNGAGDDKQAVLAAGAVLLDGGALTLHESSVLAAGPALPGGAAVVIRNGGVLTVNSGLPPDPDDGSWVFKGVDATGGILVDSGGALAGGNIGGTVRGAAGQTLSVAKGGLLDAGRGDIFVRGMDRVDIAGTYRAGLSSRLVVETGTVSFSNGGTLALSRELQRRINSGTILLADTVLVRAGGGVVFENGLPPLLTSGMGSYGLETKTDADGRGYVSVASVVNGVTGSRTESDRQRFRDNLDSIWAPGTMRRDQSDNIYNLTAVETPSVQAYGAGGLLNQAVLEAIVDGPGQAVSGHGVADQGIFEMYNGGAQWGVNTVGYHVAGEFMAGLDRRVERIGAEMDRLGEGWGGDVLYEGAASPSLFVPASDVFARRFWVGGFGREERAELDYGIAGYTYRPRGVMLGYDKTAGAFSLGAAAAYGKGDYKDAAAQSSDSAITSYSAGVYAAYHAMNGLYATAHGTVSHLDNDIRDVRGGMRREAEHTGYSWSVGGRVGYDKLLSERMMLSPSVGVERIQAVGRGHDEYLDGAGVLRVGEVTRDSTLVPIELALSYDILRSPASVLRVTGNVGYAYDFEDGALDGVFSYDGLAGSGTMAVAGREPGRHRFTVGAGLLYTGSRFDIGARYDFRKREKQTSHEAQGSIGVKF